MRKILITIIIALVHLGMVRAQQVSVEMDSTYVMFGNPMTFHLQAVVPQGQHIVFPQDPIKHGGILAYDDTLQFLLELDDANFPHVDTVSMSGDAVTLRQDLTVFAFDSASLYIPPFEFVTERGDTMRTNALALKVFVPFDSVQVDPEKYLDIKGVLTPDFVLWDYIGWFLWPLLVLALIAAAWLGYRYWRAHRPEVKEVVAPEPVLPAHIVAMQALDELSGRKLWQNGLNKQYHTELTDILRSYIERRFEVPAMESTTDQIIDSLYELTVTQRSSVVNLQQVLSLSDLVKFAKYQPLPEENQLSFVNARMFVEQTKPSEPHADEPIVEPNSAH